MTEIKIKKPQVYLYNILKNQNKIEKNWNLNEVKKVLDNYEFKSQRYHKTLIGGNSDNILIDTNIGKMVLKKYYWSLPSLKVSGEWHCW